MTREKSQNQRLWPCVCCGLCGALVGMVSLAGGGCELVWADDDTVIDVINATVPVACTISGSVDHTYTTSMLPDTTETLGPSHVKSVCNDVAGYSLYAIGFTGDSYTGDNTKMVGSLANINTGTSGPDSYWAMKAEAISGDYAPTIMNSFDNYHAIPANFTQIARFTSVTDGGTIGSNLDITYQVHASRTQTADTYTGKVKYVLVHPNNAPAPMTPLPESACSASQICYAPNAGDIDGSMSSMGTVAGSSTAGKQTGVSTNGTAVLRAPNFSRDGYGFAGWSTDFEATSTSKIYGPNETITTSTTAGAGDADVSTKGLILYPVWIASAGSIQSWSGCNNLTQAPAPSTGNRATLTSMTALTDQRDGNTYSVARLADGNCWMTENLRLDAENTTSDANRLLAQGYGDDTANNRGKFIGLADSENSNFTGDTSSATAPTNANSLYYAGTQSGTATMNIGQINYAGYRIPRYNNNNTNRTLDASYNGDDSGTYYQWYSYGNYYSWPAAMASTTYLDTYSASEAANTSLCPTGWRLPTGGNKTRIEADHNNEFWNLVVVNLNSNTLPADYDSSSTPYYNGSTEAGPVDRLVRTFPNNFVYSSYFYGSSASSRGSYGTYWSSSATNSYGAYVFDFYSTFVYPGADSDGKGYARAVRCLLDS